jgi:hypothetical protein
MCGTQWGHLGMIQVDWLLLQSMRYQPARIVGSYSEVIVAMKAALCQCARTSLL